MYRQYFIRKSTYLQLLAPFVFDREFGNNGLFESGLEFRQGNGPDALVTPSVLLHQELREEGVARNLRGGGGGIVNNSKQTARHGSTRACCAQQGGLTK
jgi:hypothetical protein